jgi:hypothetical protein
MRKFGFLMLEALKSAPFTTGLVGTEDKYIDGEAVSEVEAVGMADGLGPATVGASVGAELRQLSTPMPKHCSPALEQVPKGQASAVQQFASATS